jgi:hypothetical protein
MSSRYRVPYVPAAQQHQPTLAELLPFVQFQAHSAADAQALAHHVTGACVLEPIRLEGGAQ